jgi:hypothetical protein
MINGPAINDDILSDWGMEIKARNRGEENVKNIYIEWRH